LEVVSIVIVDRQARESGTVRDPTVALSCLAVPTPRITEPAIDGLERAVHRPKRRQETRIEVFGACPPVALEDDVTGPGVIKGGFVRPRAAQRVVLVDEHDDAPGQRDLLPGKPLRVAITDIRATVLSWAGWLGLAGEGREYEHRAAGGNIPI
jgi:hypothetical protein